MELTDCFYDFCVFDIWFQHPHFHTSPIHLDWSIQIWLQALYAQDDLCCRKTPFTNISVGSVVNIIWACFTGTTFTTFSLLSNLGWWPWELRSFQVFFQFYSGAKSNPWPPGRQVILLVTKLSWLPFFVILYKETERRREGLSERGSERERWEGGRKRGRKEG